MKKRTDPDPAADVPALRHDNVTRLNIPPAGLAARGKIVREKPIRYAYNPHLAPALRFDATGGADALPALVEAAGTRTLEPAEIKRLQEALRAHAPWLEWTGKREQPWCVADPVALHIHERVSTQAILRVARRQDLQRSLFADPEQEYRAAVQFYKWPMEWANRLILGDSLAVMASLARREALAGKVQMIYMDPPYGIKYASNFQPEVGRRDVKDRDEDLTREPEMVKAYRDTWTLGVHSYLSYLRDRLLLCKELLADTGSIFVQISDENIHRVRALLDEVFLPQNFVAQITVNKAASQSSRLLASVNDYVLWYAKERDKVKYRQLLMERPPIDDPGFRYICVETEKGELFDLTYLQKTGETPIPAGEFLRLIATTSQTGSDTSRYPYEFEGKSFVPPGSRGWSTSRDGLDRLRRADRLAWFGTTLSSMSLS